MLIHFTCILSLAVEADFIHLESGRFTGDNIDILSPNFEGFARLRIRDDTLVEGTETLQLRFVTNDTINGGSVNANITFDPSIAEVCILDDDEGESAHVFGAC